MITLPGNGPPKTRNETQVPTTGIVKDTLNLGRYNVAEAEFVADNPGSTLFHCHQQLHMDFGFMQLIRYS